MPALTGRPRLVMTGMVFLCLITVALAQQTPAPAKLEVLHTLKGHNELVYNLAFSPDNKLLATGSFDRTIKLWEVASGKELRTLQGPAAHQNIVMQVAFSPNGRMLASCSTDNTIKLWDVPVAGPLFKVVSPAVFHDLKLSPDGTQLASANADERVRLWNAVTGKETTTLTGHQGPVRCVAYSANGQWLASGGEDRSVRLWNTSNGQALGVIPAAHATPIQAIAFHPNNQVLYTADALGFVKFWTLPLNPSVTFTPAPNATITCIALSSDGKVLVVGSDDQTVRIHDPSKPTQGRVLSGPKATVTAVTTNGNLVAAAFADHNVCLWNTANGELVAQISAHRFPITGVALHPTGQLLLTCGMDGSVKLWPLPIAGKPPQTVAAKMMLTAHEQGVTSVVFHPNGKQFLTSGVEGTVKLWELPSGNLVRAFTDAKDAISGVSLSREANPTRLAAASKDRVLRIWNLADGKLLTSIPQPDDTLSVAFSPDNTKLVTGHGKGQATVWTLANGQPLQTLSVGGAARGVAFLDPLGIIAGGDKMVTRHQLGVLRVVSSHKQAITDLATTPNGSHLLSASVDGTVQMVNTVNGNVERSFKGHAGAVQCITVNKAGNALFTGGLDKTVRVFNLANGLEIKALAVPSPVQRIAVSPGQNLIVVGCAGQEVIAMNGVMTLGQPLPPDFGKVLLTEKLEGAVTGVTSATDNAGFTAASTGKFLVSYRVASEAPIRNLTGHTNLIDCIAYSPDGNQLASCSHDGTVRFWDVTKGQQVASLNYGQPPQPAYCLAWSQDGKHLVVGGVSKELRLYDAVGRKQLRECKAYDEKTNPKGHREAVSSVVFTADGKFFFSAGMDGQIKVWNTADGSFVRQFEDAAIKQPDGKSAERAHRDWINQLRFTPDSSRLLSVGDGGWLCIWSFVDGKLLYQQKFDTGLYSVAVTSDSKLMALGCRDHSALVVKLP